MRMTCPKCGGKDIDIVIEKTMRMCFREGIHGCAGQGHNIHNKYYECCKCGYRTEKKKSLMMSQEDK